MSRGRKNQRPTDQTICFCNEVKKSQIEKAIKEGADTLNVIFDHTTAGVGACGGSCRPKLQIMLDSYKQTGEFPEVVKFKKTQRRR